MRDKIREILEELSTIENDYYNGEMTVDKAETQIMALMPSEERIEKIIDTMEGSSFIDSKALAKAITKEWIDV